MTEAEKRLLAGADEERLESLLVARPHPLRSEDALNKPLLRTLCRRPVLFFEQTPSVLTEAKHAPCGSVLVAARQTAGYGRRRRAFASDVGGAYFCYKLAPALAARQANLLTLAAGVAVVEEARSCGVDARIKYPNDCTVDGKKFCGILTECVLLGDRIQSAAIGIGIDLNNTLPAELAEIATTLAAHTEQALSRAQLIARVCDRIDALLTEPGQIVARFRRYDALTGCEITLSSDQGVTHGTYVGVDGDGNLIARVNGKDVTVSIGEVTVRRKQTGAESAQKERV